MNTEQITEGYLRHQRLQNKIRHCFPGIRSDLVRLLANRVSNRLAKARCDIYEVDLSPNRNFSDKRGYFQYLEVEASGYRVFLRLLVD
jgi:hypothetical protein